MNGEVSGAYPGLSKGGKRSHNPLAQRPGSEAHVVTWLTAERTEPEGSTP